MMTYDQMLLKALRHGGSERRTAALFGISQSSLNAWVRRRALPDDDQVARMAKIIGIDPALALALVYMERAHVKECEREVTDAWRRIAEAFGKAAAVAILAIGAASFPTPANAAFNISAAADAGICIVSRRKKRRRSGLLDALRGLL